MKNSKTPKTPTTPAVPAETPTPSVPNQELKAIIRDLFLAEDGIEIPDDAVVGKAMSLIKSHHRMLAAQNETIKRLTERIEALEGVIEGRP